VAVEPHLSVTARSDDNSVERECSKFTVRKSTGEAESFLLCPDERSVDVRTSLKFLTSADRSSAIDAFELNINASNSGHQFPSYPRFSCSVRNYKGLTRSRANLVQHYKREHPDTNTEAYASVATSWAQILSEGIEHHAPHTSRLPVYILNECHAGVRVIEHKPNL
jgi:hypothetical protein